MKLKKIVFCFLAASIFASCTTTKVEETNQTKETTVEKKVEKKKEEPKDPPNIAFAKKLQSYLDKNQIKEAIDLFQSLPKELENDIDFKILLASLYISDKQYDQAIEVANLILQTEPNNMDAYELISLALEGKGDKKAQKENADKILEIDPYNATVNIQKAEDYAMNKKYKLSKQSYKKALKNDPKNVDALFGYAQMSFYTDDLEAAEKSLNTILEINPKHSLALAYMGKLAADSENFLRATKYVKEALKSLGYNNAELKKLDNFLTSNRDLPIEELIKQSLKKLF